MPRPLKPLLPILIAILALSALVIVSRLRQAKEIIPWREDWPKARQESADTGRPILLYFTATWCDPCQEMKRTTWADAKVEQALRAYVPVKADVDQVQGLALRYNVDALPAFLILDEEGEVKHSAQGYHGPEDFLKWLNAPTR